MIAGGDKGKVGTVLDVNTKRGEVVVEGVNIKVRPDWQAALKCQARWCMCLRSSGVGLWAVPGGGPIYLSAAGPLSILKLYLHSLALEQTKHVKPAAQGEEGQILKKEFPVHHSNVAVYSTAQQTHSRVGYK